MFVANTIWKRAIRKIKKGQFDTSRITTGTGAVVADIQEMVIAA
jgi:hypothetical protein